MERLIHYSKDPLVSVHDVEQDDRALKPMGLWFSVGDSEDGWRAWCEDASFGLDRLVYETDITLMAGASILRLSTAEDIDEFTHRWGHPNRFGDYASIDWKGVAAAYDGIVIAPYCWARRLCDTTFWYYAWDCASGCVWRTRAVEAIRPSRHAAAGIIGSGGSHG